MTSPLLFLVADKDIEQACKGCFLDREDWAQRFGCRKIDIGDRDFVVPAGQKDPGLFARGHEIARRYLATHDHLVVLLDSAWQGSPEPRRIERELRKRLERNGWSAKKFEVIAIEPELEAWVWSDRRGLYSALRDVPRREDLDRLHALLSEKARDEARANDPKAELVKLRERLGISASSAQFRRFAKVARIDRCTDPAFARLREALQRSFPA